MRGRDLMSKQLETQPTEVIESPNKQSWLGRAIIYTLLISLSIIMLFPFLWLVRSSVMSTSQIFTFPPEWIPRPLKLSNYPEALTVVPFARYLFNTLFIEFWNVTGTLITCSLAA